jgi:hypothetical protein
MRLEVTDRYRLLVDVINRMLRSPTRSVTEGATHYYALNRDTIGIRYDAIVPLATRVITDWRRHGSWRVLSEPGSTSHFLRFGWIDHYDDEHDVRELLYTAVAAFARVRRFLRTVYAHGVRSDRIRESIELQRGGVWACPQVTINPALTCWQRAYALWWWTHDTFLPVEDRIRTPPHPWAPVEQRESFVNRWRVEAVRVLAQASNATPQDRLSVACWLLHHSLQISLLESYAAWLAVVCNEPERSAFGESDVMYMHRATLQLVAARGDRTLQLIEIGPPGNRFALHKLVRRFTGPGDTAEHDSACAAVVDVLSANGLHRRR